MPSASLEKLKQSRMLAAQRIPFSTKDLAKMIVKLIVAQDLVCFIILVCLNYKFIYICIQSLNLIESREFRDLLLFLRETLNDQDIPHRTKLRSLIIEEWVEY